MALAENVPLILTPLPDNSDWSKGMILFVDNKNHKFGKKDQCIHQWLWSYQKVKINWQGFRSNHYLVFSSELRHAAANGRFELIDQSGNSVTIRLNRFGRLN